MPIQMPPDGATRHAVEAVKHLWMVPYTILGTVSHPRDGFAASITKDAKYALQHQDDESFWHFSAAALAYVDIAASAVINTLANHDNRDEVGELNAELIDEELEEANHHVTMAIADWFRAAQFHYKLDDVVYDVSTVNDHPSGFDCTRNTSQNISWFHCANGDNDRQAPCLNCPAMQKLGNPIYRTKLDRTIDNMLKLSTGERYEPDLQQLGPLPSPEGPAAHCRHAIQHLAEMAHIFRTQFTPRHGISYAALATNDAAEELRHLDDYVTVENDIINIKADTDRITAAILSGETLDEQRSFTQPDEGGECIFQQELTTAKTKYICAPADAPADWTDDDFGHDEPCRLCPMKSGIPETDMDRTLHRLAQLTEHA